MLRTAFSDIAMGRTLTFERFFSDSDCGYAVEGSEHSGFLSKGHTGKNLES